jgi:hypothetical protein
MRIEAKTFMITAESIHGKVFLCWGAKRWTQNMAEAHAYKEESVRQALRNAAKRFHVILKDIRLEPMSIAC